MNVLIVDAHSVGYTQHESKKGLKTGDQLTGAIFGFLEFIQAAAAEQVYDRIEVLWDGKTTWRKEFYAGYKAKRSTDPKTQLMREEFRSQIALIKKMLHLAGVDQMYSPTAEADDLGGWRSAYYSANGHKVELATGDKDWLQLVNEFVSWYSPRQKQRVTKASFEIATGVATTSQFVQAKALQGDTSDCIPGVGKIGEKGAIEILNEYGSVPKFIMAVRAAIKEAGAPNKEGKYKGIDKAHSLFATDAPSEKEPELGRIQVFKRNLELMTLRSQSQSDVITLAGEFNEAGMREFCQQWAFQSYLEDFQKFVYPLRELASNGIRAAA